MSTVERISKKIKRLRRGKAYSLSIFMDCGSENAVRTAISRLTKRGLLIRVAQGIYARPKPHRFFHSILPTRDEIISVRAQQTGEQLGTHGAELVRRFGLSTQVPVGTVLYTSGRARTFKTLAGDVYLEHAPEELLSKNPSALHESLLVLRYLGPNQITEKVYEAISQRVPMADIYKSEHITQGTKQALSKARLQLAA